MPILIILLFVAFFWSKIRTAANLDFSFDLPEKARIAGLKLFFVQPVQLINITATALNVRGIDMLFQSETGIPVGTAYLSGFWRVPPNGSVTLPVNVTIPIARLLSVIPEIRKQIKTGELVVRFQGVVNAEGVTVPIYQTIYKYQLPNLF